MKSSHKYNPPMPAPPEHIYTFEMSGSERISFIAAMQRGLRQLVQQKHFKEAELAREMLIALDVNPCA